METATRRPAFPTPGEIHTELIQVEQGIRFLADANSLNRRLDCLDDDCRYSNTKDLLFRVVDTLATVLAEQLRTVGERLTDDLPF